MCTNALQMSVSVKCGDRPLSTCEMRFCRSPPLSNSITMHSEEVESSMNASFLYFRVEFVLAYLVAHDVVVVEAGQQAHLVQRVLALLLLQRRQFDLLQRVLLLVLHATHLKFVAPTAHSTLYTTLKEPSPSFCNTWKSFIDDVLI